MAWDNTQITTTGQVKRKKIAICFPHKGYYHSEFTFKTWFPLMLPVSWAEKIPIHSGTYSITISRNDLLEAAIKNECDYILWVDTDMIVESVGTKNEEGKEPVPFKTHDPNLALKGLFEYMEQNNDIKFISGLYRAKKEDGFCYAAWKKIPTKGYLPISEWSGNLIEVDTVGLGFTLMKTDILKDENSPSFHWERSRDISEDFYFCEKLKEKGVRILVHTDIRLSHGAELFIKSDGSVRVRDS